MELNFSTLGRDFTLKLEAHDPVCAGSHGALGG